MAGNLLSSELTAENVRVHSGFSNTKDSTFQCSSANPSGICFDGTNMIVAGQADQEMIRYVAKTSTEDVSFSTGFTQYGAGWDGTNVMTSNNGTETLFVGFTSSVDTTFAGQPNRGLTPDQNNDTLGNRSFPRNQYRYVGFTNSLDTSNALPGTNVRGYGWDGENALFHNHSGPTVIRFVNFSNTIDTSFGTTDFNGGLGDDSFSGGGGGAAGANPSMQLTGIGAI